MKANFFTLFIYVWSINTHAQVQVHAVNSGGGDIAKLESQSGFPQLLYSNDHGNIARIGLEESTNVNAVNDDNLLLQGLKSFSKIKLRVGTAAGGGLVTVNPTSPSGVFTGAFVGINTQSPTAPLTVNGLADGEVFSLKSNGGLNSLWMQFSPGGSNKALIGFNDTANLDDFRIVKNNDIGNYMQFATNNVNRMAISDFGQVYIGDVRSCANLAASPAMLNVDGDIRAKGGFTGFVFTCSSDVRFKKNIAKISKPIQKLKQLNGYSYHWRAGEVEGYDFNEEPQLGLIAQEVETVFPELVKTGHDGYKSVDYNSMTAVLVEAIKVQQAEIEDLKKLVNKLIAEK